MILFFHILKIVKNVIEGVGGWYLALAIALVSGVGLRGNGMCQMRGG
jgi:hypothetical protein